jgi:phosphatidylglycerophosphatase A
LFDIWKPFPISYFDRTLKGGFGVMLDDVLAAFYAVVAVRVVEQLANRGLQ